MTARAIWRSEQPSYEQPIWSSQRPATPPSFHLRTPDDRDLDAVTWTRATTKSVTDYQGNVHQALSGEVPWEGYRRVRNLLTHSFPTANGINGFSVSQLTPTITTGYTIYTDVASNNFHYVSLPATGFVTGAHYCALVVVSAASIPFLRVGLYLGGTGGNYKSTFDTSTWAVGAYTSGSPSGRGVMDLGDGRYMLWVSGVAQSGHATGSVEFAFQQGDNASQYTGDTGDSARVHLIGMCIFRPGQTEPDRELADLSVGVLSTPYHGAKVDGVMYFATDDQGRLIDGTRGYDRDGSGAWVESSSVTPIATGLSIGSAQTNRITYSSDLSNAAWTKRGACTATAAYDAQVGVYSAITGIGANGTNDVYVLTTGNTGGSRIERAFMMRSVSAVGTLSVGNPNDLALGRWTIDLALVSTTRFERIDRFHPAVTIVNEFYANGAGGGGVIFYTASGTLAVDVSLVTQVEAWRVQSLIYSAGSVTAKNADAPAFTSMPGYTSNNAGTVVMDFVPLASTDTAATYIAGPQVVYKASADDKLYQTDGTTASNFGDQVARTRTKIATNWQAGVGRYGYRDGVSKFAATAYDGSWATSTLTLAGPQRLRELSIYPSALTTAQLQALSA